MIESLCFRAINIANANFFMLTINIIFLLAISLFHKYHFKIASRMKVIIFISYRRCMLRNAQEIVGGPRYQFNRRHFGIDFFPHLLGKLRVI